MDVLYVLLALVSLQGVSSATLKSCGGSLSGLHGNFQSPGFPNNYPTNVQCTWQLRVPAGHHIKIVFREFHIGQHSADCEYDKVIVKDGTTPIGLFCGTSATDGPIMTKSNQAVVQLTSDYSDTAPGFWAYFTAIDNNECETGNGGCDHYCYNYIGGYSCSCRAGYELQSDRKSCKVVCNGIQKTDLKGVIWSPDFPLLYPNQLKCDWSIIVPLGYQIELTFSNFHIESHNDVKCSRDYVKVDTGRIEDRYCGHTAPSKIVSLANRMHVFFVSDDSVGHAGFKATYKAKTLDCGDPGTPKHGSKVGTNHLFLNKVSYSCNQGFSLTGSARRTCQSNGLWSGTAPKCERVSCGDPGIPVHGTRTIVSGIGRAYVFEFEDEIRLKCDPYYAKASGNETRRCLHNGQWSGSQLKCYPICGRTKYYIRNRIIGGGKVPPGVYPWMAMLYQNPCQRTHCAICGGTILNNNYVLTGAHCISDSKNNKFVVRVGGVRTRVNGTNEWWCTVKNTIIHPSYNKNTFDYDVALIEVDRCSPVDASKTAANEIVMTDYIRPICLPTSTDSQSYQINRIGYAAGWGRRNTANTASFSPVLHNVLLPVVSTQACQNHFSSLNWLVTQRMFCARDDGKDTCQGDTGGPFMVNRQSDRKWVITGIVSWGDTRCATGYGVYVKVGYGGIVGWIKKTLKL